MGCGASSERPTASEPVAAKAAASKAAAEKTAVAQAAAKAEEKGAAKKKAASGVPAALVALAAATAPNFELSTPMLVSPFLAFEEQGRICKSVKAWRNAALKDGRLIEYVRTAKKPPKKKLTIIFISHTWWDRAFKDSTNDPNDKYDKGAPDWQSGAKKDLKWRLICQGVRKLVAQEQERGIELKLEEVALWIDWQSIYQDDKAQKLKGVMSLIKVCPAPSDAVSDSPLHPSLHPPLQYSTLSDYMLVPTEEKKLPVFPEDIPGYGKRGWCRCSLAPCTPPQARAWRPHAARHTGHDARTLHGRCEYFIYSCWAVTQGKVEDYKVPGSGVPLYAIKKDGTLQQYPEVTVLNPECMPSGGDFANPEADRPNVKAIEDRMISFFGNCLVEAKCKPENWVSRGGKVDLHAKMLRDEHVDALAAALAKYEVFTVDLNDNQLGPEGAAKLAKALKTNTTLKFL